MITTKTFGRTLAGEPITLYTMTNGNGMEASVMDFGAILVNLIVPNDKGEKADVVLGY
ncbi:MAG: galactose-1-epimerase, partial [Lachnospiraceae bacterium]|nr:galactose-1-epimerase [Lachnospiraceae bacterium]